MPGVLIFESTAHHRARCAAQGGADLPLRYERVSRDRKARIEAHMRLDELE